MPIARWPAHSVSESQRMGNALKPLYEEDSSCVQGDHEKHLKKDCLPREAIVLLRKTYFYPVSGSCNAVIASISRGFETTVERGDLHPTIHKSVTDSLTAVICEVVHGEYAVMHQARGKRELNFRLTTGQYDYHIATTIRYGLQTEKLVMKQERSESRGDFNVVDFERTKVHSYICSVITVLQKPTDMIEEVRQALPPGIYEFPEDMKAVFDDHCKSTSL